MKNIIVFLATGFEEIEAITPIDVWRRAGFNVLTVSIQDQLEVIGAHNIVVKADILFEEINSEVDVVLLPGGMPGTLNLQKHEGLQSYLKQQYSANKLMTAICAAPTVYGQNGILKGKNATCFPGFENDLNGANFTGNSVEIDENIVTGKGAGVALEFALKVVATLLTKDEANALKSKLQAP